MTRSLKGVATFLTVMIAGPALADTPGKDAKIIRSVQSGPWSDAKTWENGQVPAAGVKVLVREGHAVQYDVKSDAVLRSLHVAGVLYFAHDMDTLLNVGLIKIQHGESTDEDGFDCKVHPKEDARPAGDGQQPGFCVPCLCCDGKPSLLIGTPEQPIDAKHTALIRLHYVEGMDRESCPAIVCCGGRMDFHGAPLSRTWVKLGATAKAGNKGKPNGDTTLTLDAVVSGWRVGDRVIVTATGSKNKMPETETRVIKAIDGKTLTLDQGLAYEHLGEGEYRAEVANLSRNVVVESADPAGIRGHTMYHKKSAGSISYAEFRHLGKQGLLGRYSLHFHLCGDTMRGSSIVGASIHDSQNRWITVHGTNYLVVRDTVGFKSVGHGFFLEDGTEVYNVFDRNLACQALEGKPLPKQPLPFDANEGAGFWWANSLNTFTNNVSCDNGEYGFRYEASPKSIPKLGKGKDGPTGEPFALTFSVRQPDGSRKEVDIRTLPFIRFENNEAHNISGYGLNVGEFVGGVGPDLKNPFVIRNMKIWRSGKGYTVQAPAVLVEGMTIHQTGYGVWGSIYRDQDYRQVVLSDVRTYFNDGSKDAVPNRVRLPGQKSVDGDGGNGPGSPSEVAKLTPVDGLPPMTVITQVRVQDGKLLVRGTTSDNGTVTKVLVNGKEARTLAANFAEWEVALDGVRPGSFQLTAHAEDAAGNVELTKHQQTLMVR